MAQNRRKKIQVKQKAERQMEVTSYFERDSDFVFNFSSARRAIDTPVTKNKKAVEPPRKKKRKASSGDRSILHEILNPPEAHTMVIKNARNFDYPMTAQRRIFSHVEIPVVWDRLNKPSNPAASSQANPPQKDTPMTVVDDTVSCFEHQSDRRIKLESPIRSDEEEEPTMRRQSAASHKIAKQDLGRTGLLRHPLRKARAFPNVDESDSEIEILSRKRKRKSRNEEDLEAEFVAESISSELDDFASTPESSIVTNGEEGEIQEETPRRQLNQRRKTTKQPRQRKTKLDLDLPPLSDIRDIFRDLTLKALDHGFRGVTTKGDRVLRIGTMCSGTEAPLLALRLVDNCLKELGENGLVVKHEFSAEIEPFKQAYIERNFNPPLLFRDVTEFLSIEGSPPEGTTAYGSRHAVPCDIHMLIAGSACVDFSLLNNNPNAKGESEDTRLAIVAYASFARPAIVLLENVLGQAISVQADGHKRGKEKGKDDVWTRYTKDFAKINYATQIVKADTKDYYLPHTRQRKYMLCLDRSTFGKKVDKYLASWGDLMKNFQRPASAPITSFLLRSDDPRYLRMAFGDSIKEIAVKPWERCRGRHEKARTDGRLGPKRPITTRLPDHSDRRWLQNRPERDQEVLDIVHLRHARDGVDALFKTRPVDLSQNVDRNEGWTWGITGCLTPSGMPFLSDQCRRVTGYEALKLQGIDIDEVSFTSETDANLRDLAGNAMSSTVVGPAILSALIVAHKDLPVFVDSPTDKNLSVSITKPRIYGENQLSAIPTLSRIDQSIWVDMIADARQTAKHCHCEGESGISRQPILVCKECEHTACKRCAGNPKHVYDQDLHNSSRLSPMDFQARWRSRVPARLRLEKFPDLSDATIDTNIKKNFVALLKHSLDEVFSFQEMKRSKNWTIGYRSPQATLEMVIGKDVVWWLYVDPPPELAANSRLRAILEKPIARAKVLPGADIFALANGWECYIPFRQQTSVRIAGHAERTPSWRARQGLKDFQEEQVSKQFEITLIGEAVDEVFHNVPGIYELRPDCGTACGSLHKKLSNDTEQLYFFLDPDPIGDVSNDRFVFATNHERLHSGERRTVLAYLDPSWRPRQVETFRKEFTLRADGLWIPCRTRLKAVNPEIIYAVPKPLGRLDVVADIQGCHDAMAIMSLSAPVAQAVAAQWGSLQYIDGNKKSFFKTFNWLLVSVPGLDCFADWRSLDLPTTRCSRCSPDPPSITWLQTDGKKLVMQEDHLAAALYERTIKDRPPGFVVQAGCNDKNFMQVKVGISLQSLSHQAVARISARNIKLEWNLDTKYFEPTIFKFPRFRLRSNEDEFEHAQPSKMRLKLRSDQARSLTWMVKQESGVSFRFEEVEEALLPAIGWKVDVKASANVSFKGGVLADEPSYGKTITSLTIINQEFVAKSPQSILDTFITSDTGLINSAATLIITPNHLTSQWRRELAKFCGGFASTEAIVIRTVQDLKKLTASQLCKAKVVIASWSMFMHEYYAARLAEFAAYPEPSTIKGREYRVWQEHAIPELPKNIRVLQHADTKTFEKVMAQRMRDREEDPMFQAVVPSKRLKGAKYVAKKQHTIGKDSTNKKSKSNKANTFISTSGDWKSLQFPILHIYRWNRLMVDEFSYLLKDPDEAFDRSGKKFSYREYSPAFTAVTELQAEKRWVLSGTPPLRDFVDVNMIASFLGLKLGVDSFAPEATNIDNFKNMRSELSAFEKFRSYQEKRSYCWHKRRHDLAQSFLDLFVRQNTAQVNDIQCFPSIEPVALTFDHAIIQEELYQHLRLNEMNVSKKEEDSTSDQGRRINSILAASGSADEALLRSCAVLNSTITNHNDRILKRKQELNSLKSELADQIALAENLKGQSNEKERNLYNQWFKKQQFGDPESDKTLQELRQRSLKATTKASSSQMTLRVLVDKLERLGRNLTARIRSLRYLESLNRLLSSPINECDDTHCMARCPVSDMQIITACGHVVCFDCLSKRNEPGRCVVLDCGVEVFDLHIRSRELFDMNTYTSRQQTFGAKLDAIVDLIQSIPKDDQLLLFLQSKDLIQHVKDCLEYFEISYHSLDRTAKENLTAIEHFQETKGKAAKKVLILLLAGEQASGLNLTKANHIVFLSPLLAKTQYEYESNMKQAIRRARRYGQEKAVHVYRFVALRTIDVDIMEQRERLLTEPLRTRDHPNRKSQVEPSREQKPKPEKSRLVRTTKGKFVLKPLSTLDDGDHFEETYGSGFPMTHVDEDLNYEDE